LGGKQRGEGREGDGRDRKRGYINVCNVNKKIIINAFVTSSKSKEMSTLEKASLNR